MMADPVEDIIGDYRAFVARQRDRLSARGIDIAPYPLSHLAYRVPEWEQYVHVRTLLERHANANEENVWNGRPISMILLAQFGLTPQDVLVELARREGISGIEEKAARKDVLRDADELKKH